MLRIVSDEASPREMLTHVGDQTIFNIVARHHPTWFGSLPYTFNFLVDGMDASSSTARTKRTMWCSHKIYIAHGNNHFFVKHPDIWQLLGAFGNLKTLVEC